MPGESHFDACNYLAYKRIKKEKTSPIDEEKLRKLEEGKVRISMDNASKETNLSPQRSKTYKDQASREGTVSPKRSRMSKELDPEVGGVRWSEAGEKLKDPYEKKAFVDSLSKEDKGELLRLATEEKMGDASVRKSGRKSAGSSRQRSAGSYRLKTNESLQSDSNPLVARISKHEAF